MNIFRLINFSAHPLIDETKQLELFTMRKTYRKPCSCVLRYTEWSKKSFRCGISIFCPLILTPPPDTLFILLLFVRCLLLVDFEWNDVLFVRLWLFVVLLVTIVELLVRDSDTSRLNNNDLLVNDNFSVVNSSRLLGELAVVWLSSDAVTVVKVELTSDKFSVAVEWTSFAVAVGPKLLVVLCNVEWLRTRIKKMEEN